MPQLNADGRRVVDALAQRYGVSTGAVMTLLQALIQANGRMAQFEHPELGGSGQWMRGGMTMVGDMFNNALKAKVDSLCTELAARLANEPFMAAPQSNQSQSQFQGGARSGYGEPSLFVSGAAAHRWWPDELGIPASTGSQNNIRYAFFPSARRLAIDLNGQLTLYDTLDHQIGGVSQQQSQGASLTFTSQRGLVRLAELPLVSAESERGGEACVQLLDERPFAAPPERPSEPPPSSEDIFGKLERLAELKQKGILSDEEFATKKAELLARL